MMDVLVLLLVLFLIKLGTSEQNNINTPLGSFCGGTPATIQSNFVNNRNFTLAEMRRQLSNKDVYYARAEGVAEGDSVFGAAQCRRYLSTTQCLACYDAGISQMANCTSGTGAYALFDNCFVRYENYQDFYNQQNSIEDARITTIRICGEQSASQPTIFSHDIDGLLSDIKKATPKMSNFYVASSRKIASVNTTVYSIAQCVENTSLTICQTCLNTVYTNLNYCFRQTEGRSTNMGCILRYSEAPFFSANQTTDIKNVLKGHSSKASIIGGVAGGIGLLFMMIILWLLLRRRKMFLKTKSDEPELKTEIYYNYKDLQLATNNFNKDNILGKGGFGEVFKAILDDNTIVAVKKIEVRYAKAKEDFENEVKLISNVDHRSLLRLLGWSSEGSHLLLVLEYMPNGSLDRFLWGAKRGTLNWSQRYDIILGIASGLVHLHNEFHVKIIHRDIKSSNILLDNDFRPKIADFGLARCQADDQSHISTKYAGTLGYTAPEYLFEGRLSDKVDTYSFGIVILEIISGRRCTDMNSDRPSMDYLLEDAWKSYENKKHIEIIDETLHVNKYQEEHVLRIIEIALLCTQSPVSKRPTVSEVVLMLQDGQSFRKRQLTKPTFIEHKGRIHIGTSNKAIHIGNISGMPKELETDELLHNDKPYDKVDVMEKGVDITMV